MGRKKKAAASNSSHANAHQRPQHYDADTVRSFAHDQWADILSVLGGVSSEFFNGNHCPCPKCGGTDRFRFSDDGGDGSAICNQCLRHGGNGFKVLEWLTGRKFYECVVLVAEHLGVPPSNERADWKSNGHGHSKNNADPAENLTFQEWDESTELLAGLWCLTKPPITIAAIKLCGGRLARYRNRFTVIALPVHGEQLTAAKPVGWTLYNATGGTLPSYHKNSDGSFTETSEKILTTYGSKPGFIGPVDQLAATTEIWKLEGPSDLLSYYSLESIPTHACAFTNPHGAGERPARWMLDKLTGKSTITLHDADEPGQQGSIGYTDSANNFHPGWANELASVASSSRNAILPYLISETHGKDLRDYLIEIIAAQAATPLVPLLSPYAHLQQLAEAAETISPPSSSAAPKPLEAPDNYHRLARVNLERYARDTTNGTLRYWRNEWYKYDGTCYRKIDTDELKAKVGQAVREEFERINAEELAVFDGDGEPPNIRNVGHALISNVLFATAQLCILSGTVEFNTWIDGPHRDDEHRYVALQNGILDIDALLAGKSDYLKPHSPDWFSVTCLPFEFNDEADSPRFTAFLNRNLEADPDRIALLMEWAGYLLLPNTDYQKFIFFEGEGANGKSVFLAAIEAMIGEANCSHVSLEAFSKDFVLTQTLGKLVNIASECSEMDSVAEGMLKAVASGDRMTFNRKGIPPIEATPTARLMLSANVRPRFADKSSGLWRRMILMPWRIAIPEGERTIGMDKVGWWERSGELAGIFNWALSGLAQLTDNRGFTRSTVCEMALADYRNEVNPAKGFLMDHYVEGTEFDMIETKALYEHYKEWSLENGYRPASDRTIGREVSRQFPNVVRERRGPRSGRFYAYVCLRSGHPEDQKAEQHKSEILSPVSPNVSYQNQEIGDNATPLLSTAF